VGDSARDNAGVGRSRTVLVVLTAVAVTVAAGCSRGDDAAAEAPEDFCRAAERFESEIERQSAKGKIDTSRQITRVEELVAAAPADIRDEAEVFLDALRRVDDDPALRDDPKIQQAVDDVNRFAAHGCGFYERRQPGGI
jgi:hypothetical protein